MPRSHRSGFVDSAYQKVPGEAGGGLSTSAVEKLNEFFTTFDARNVVNHEQLAAAVQEAKGLLKGVDAKRLKSSDAMRAELVREFAGIEHQLEGMVQHRRRGIAVGE